jgi:hypothetical protein
MKRLLAALTLALLCSVALAVSAANATHSNGTGPNHDFVNGSGILDFGPVFGDGATEKFHVDAKSAADGSQAQGKMFLQEKNFPIDQSFQADVTCLNVVGNSASIGGEVTRSNNPGIPEGSGVQAFVTDNGEPGDQDRYFGAFTESPPEVCPPPNPRIASEKGNFVVHDATTL